MKNTYTIIEIGEHSHPCKFGFNALRKYSLMTNTKLSELQSLGYDMSLDNALTLCFCGIEDGYRAAKQEFNLTIDDLSDQFDGNFEAIEKVFETLADQMNDGFNEKKKTAKKVTKKK